MKRKKIFACELILAGSAAIYTVILSGITKISMILPGMLILSLGVASLYYSFHGDFSKVSLLSKPKKVAYVVIQELLLAAYLVITILNSMGIGRMKFMTPAGIVFALLTIILFGGECTIDHLLSKKNSDL